MSVKINQHVCRYLNSASDIKYDEEVNLILLLSLGNNVIFVNRNKWLLNYKIIFKYEKWEL